MWYVYFLELVNKNIYVGCTNDLSKRVQKHRNAQVESTKSLLPLRLKSYLVVPTKKKALELEKYFKTGSGKAILKKRILTKEDFIK